MRYPLLKGGTLERRCSCSTPNFSAANWDFWTFTTLTQNNFKKHVRTCNDVIYRQLQRWMFPFNLYQCVFPELWVNTWIKPLQRYLGNKSVLIIDLWHLRVTHATDKETQYYYFAAVVVFLLVKCGLLCSQFWALVETFQGKASKRWKKQISSMPLSSY